MKKKLLLSITAISLMLASAGVGAYAASNMQEIKAYLNKGISFKVDGKTWVPKDQKGNTQYAITYNGSTYVPLRAAGSALGVEVGWDAANNAVHLGDGAAAVEGRAAKSFNVDVKLDNGPMTLKISKVVFDPTYKEHSFSAETQAAIILDVTVENTSNDSLDWYIDQSQLVLNTKEQIETTLSSEPRISSEFNGKVVKKGKVVFPVKDSKFEDITNIRLITTLILNNKDFERVADGKEVEIVLSK